LRFVISNALRYGPCVTRGSHSFTCHPHTNHICFYSPAQCHHLYTYPVPTNGWPGWVDLGGWLYTEINVLHRELSPDMVTHPIQRLPSVTFAEEKVLIFLIFREKCYSSATLESNPNPNPNFQSRFIR